MQDKIENIISQVRQLPFDEQMKLIQRIAADLMPREETTQSHYLVHGKYGHATGISTEEDFKMAEWQPSEKDLNGE